MTELFRYEADAVDVEARDLPGLKARFLVNNVLAGAVVLDVGCGGGKMLRTLARYRPEAVLHGCDIKNPASPVSSFEFRSIDPGSGVLPYQESSVDVALVFDVLEHVAEPAQLLDEVARVLRPGGVLVAFVPVEGEVISWYNLFRWVLGPDLYVKTKDHVQAFRHADVEAMVGLHFEVEQRRYAYHVIGQLMDAAFCAALTVPVVRRLFWTESPYHNRVDRPRSWTSRCFTTLLVAGNAIAWAESRCLARVRLSAGGVLLTARRRASS